MLYKGRFKLLFLLFVILILLFNFNKYLFNDNKLKFANQIYKDDLVLNVFINGNLCAYDYNSDSYYYSSDSLNDDFMVKFNSLYELDYFIEKIDSLNYYIYAYNDSFFEKLSVIITTLPIVDVKNLNISYVAFNDFYENFNFFSFDYLNNDEVIPKLGTHFIDPQLGDSYFSNSSLSLRGSSSIWFDKKAYKLSFDKNINIFDLPKDDKYVLDALYVDKSKIRNMLSTDIWNIINNNQMINNDLKGRFVELFIDDEYLGLYVFKEKVDKSITSISDNGTLLKAIFHIDDNMINSLINDSFPVNNNVFLNYEIKQYNNESTKNIISKMRNYYINNQSYSAIKDNFIIDNFFNYKVFVSLISGGDNVSYNQYYSLKDNDSNILITPWDMDLTWGLYWNDFTRIRGVFSMESSNNTLWMDYYIMNDLDEESQLILKSRYWELRNDVINMEVIGSYLNKYKDLLVNSCATKRDSLKWYRYDVSEEIELIRIWANNRIQFLDEYFKL